MPDVIASFSEEYEFLSNFYRKPVEVSLLGNKMKFPTNEHAFQAMKARAIPNGRIASYYAFGLTKSITPTAAKAAGRMVSIDLPKWEAMKDDCMREVVFAKFLQDSDLCSKLLDTRAVLLVEGNTWGDEYWGRCNGKGLNRLGAILMEVRGYWTFSAKADTLPMTEQQAHIMMGW